MLMAEMKETRFDPRRRPLASNDQVPPPPRRRRDGRIIIMTRLQTGRPVFDSQRGQKHFLFATASRPALELTQPPIQWAPGALSAGVKRPGREPGHSTPSGAEVKKERSYTTNPQYVLMVRYLVKNRIRLRGMVLG
jgi:hypothetical protein